MTNEAMAAEPLGARTGELLLVERARAGDSVAFEALVESRLDRAYRLAKAITADSWAAEDITQEAFVQAWRNLGRLRDPERFDAWFARILVNAARMHVRRQRSVITVAVEAIDPREPALGQVDREIERLPSLDLLQRAINRLGIEERTPLSLQYVDDRPIKEIAAILGIPLGTAKWRLHEARASLGRAMELER